MSPTKAERPGKEERVAEWELLPGAGPGRQHAAQECFAEAGGLENEENLHGVAHWEALVKTKSYSGGPRPDQ